MTMRNSVETQIRVKYYTFKHVSSDRIMNEKRKMEQEALTHDKQITKVQSVSLNQAPMVSLLK